MKVLLVGNYLPDRQDSMQHYAGMLESGLRARGHEVRLLHPPAVLGGRMAPDSLLSKWSGYVDKFLLFRSELERAAADADIVHLCDHSNAMYVRALARYPHVVTCHDILAIRSALGHFPQNTVGATGRIFQRLIASGLRRANTILCVSNKTRDDLHAYLGIPGSRLHVIHNALHWPYAPLDESQRGPLLHAVGLRQGEDYFFHLGANHWYKNRSAVLEIFAELRKLPEFACARLVMAGGALTPKLLALAKEKKLGDALVAVTGSSHEQLQALYSGAIATLFPSFEEGFGWPILESQACGCPVITSDRAPMNEVAGGAGILIDPSQPALAAVTVASTLERDAARLRAAGLRNASSYSSGAMLDACESLYREVMTAQYTPR